MTGSIVLETCNEFGIDPDDFFGRGHKRVLVQCRRTAIDRLKDAGFSMAGIARLIRRNYSTVRYWMKPDLRAKHNQRALKYMAERRRGGKMRDATWTDQETLTLRAMVSEGKTYAEIGIALDRTYAAIKARVRYINISKDTRDSANAKKRARRIIKTAPKNRVDVSHRPEIPDEVMREAMDRRISPRSLTATLMGDPEPNRRRL